MSDLTKGAVVVGVMSGTSLDGISAAAVHLHDDDQQRPQARLLSFAHRAYTPTERRRLEDAMRQATAQEYCRVNAEMGEQDDVAQSHPVHGFSLKSETKAVKVGSRASWRGSLRLR